jgi:hypothetical protein
VRYALHQFKLIRKLDDAVKRFESEPSTQYNAMVSALRAQSDLMDKIYEKGHQFGVIQRKQAPAEAGKKRVDLLKDLRKERKLIDSLIGELEVTVEKRVMRIEARETKRQEIREDYEREKLLGAKK